MVASGDSDKEASVLSLAVAAFGHFYSGEVSTLAPEVMTEIKEAFPGPVLHSRPEVKRTLDEAGAALVVPGWERERTPKGDDVYGWGWLPSAIREPSLGTLGVLLPEGVLNSYRHATFRKELFEFWEPSLVLIGRSGFSSVHPLFNVAFILATPRSETDNPVAFLRCPDGGSNAVAADLKRLLKMRGGRTEFGYVHREQVDASSGLGFERYDPRIGEASGEISAFGETDPLGDLYLVERSGRLSRSDIHEGAQGSGIRLIGGRDVLRDGTLAPADRSSRWIAIEGDSEVLRLSENDLLVRAISNPNDSGGFVAARVDASSLPAAADRGVLVLRERSPLSDERRLVVSLLLGSSRAMLIASRLGEALSVSPSALRALPVPRLDAALSESIRDLVDSALIMSEWQREAEALLSNAFDSGSIAAARERIVQGGRLFRQRVEAAKELDNFDTVVRIRYPYPIAYRWRGLQALSSGDDPERTYRAALECFEAVLAYAATVGLALARREGIEVKAQSDIQRKLTSRADGVSLGDWVAVLQEMTGAAYRRLDGSHPLSNFPSFFAEGSEARAAVKRLSGRRNDLAHTRRTARTDAEGAIESLEDLRRILEAAAFFADFPLLQVVDSKWDAFAGSASVRYRVFVGDHSA